MKDAECCRVAVLMAAYNGMRYIDEQVRTILSQTAVQVHLFISVDPSSDDTLAYCISMSHQNANITVLPSRDERFGDAAKNFYRLIRDVDLQGFQYIALADQDDIWHKDKLQKAIAHMDKHSADAYSSNVIAFWEGTSKKKCIRKDYPQTNYDYYFESAGPGCTYVFRVEQLMSFQDFLNEHWSKVNEVTYHDWLLYAFFRSRNKKWVIDAWSSMFYRQHEQNQIGSNIGFNALGRRIGMLQNRWYAKEVRKIYTLLPMPDDTLLSRKFLVLHFWQLRRRLRDKWVVLFLILFGKLP